MDPESTPQQKAAKVTWWLAHGEELRTRDIARKTGLSICGAYEMMVSLSLVLPIYLEDHTWRVLDCRESESD